MSTVAHTTPPSSTTYLRPLYSLIQRSVRITDTERVIQEIDICQANYDQRYKDSEINRTLKTTHHQCQHLRSPHNYNNIPFHDRNRIARLLRKLSIRLRVQNLSNHQFVAKERYDVRYSRLHLEVKYCYQIPCGNCNSTNVVETNIHVSKRPENSGQQSHEGSALQLSHNIYWQIRDSNQPHSI